MKGAIGYEGYRLYGESPDIKSGPNLLVLGVGGGVHFFVTPNVSIDAALTASFGAGKQTAVLEDEDQDPDMTLLRFQILTLLGLSGWF